MKAAHQLNGHGHASREVRRVLITGGSSGIGAATARAFAGRRCPVAVAGRDEVALKKVACETRGVSIPGDLREPGCPERTVENAATALGGLDVVVSNAGTGWHGPFRMMRGEDIDVLLDVNLRAAAHLARASLRHLPPGSGRLVFVGSIAGAVGVAGEAWYSATKAGLATLADVLRAELATDGIGVTVVTPGAVDTPFFKRSNAAYLRSHPRLRSAEEVADAIVDAVERSRDEVILPGWLWLPARLKATVPTLYRVLENRFENGAPLAARQRELQPEAGQDGAGDPVHDAVIRETGPGRLLRCRCHQALSKTDPAFVRLILRS